MNELTTHIYTSGDTLPESLLEENFFHSRNLFELSRHTPRHRPYMVTMEQADGTVMAQLLALVRYRSSFIPPFFFMHCRILGEGAYRLSDGSEATLYGHTLSTVNDEERAILFDNMLAALMKRIDGRVLYTEVSHLSEKMFGYRWLRANGFFPVKWMSIHNSLHSRLPEERIGHDQIVRIKHAQQRGVETKEVVSENDFRAFIRLLRHHNWFKPRRYVPADEFFKGLMANPHGKLFITRYHEHVVGCSAMVFSQNQAFLWFTAFRRKSFVTLHPDDITVWQAIQTAYQQGCEHIFFMDVGLPFEKNPYRDFILKFGGKPVSTYRWFHCDIGWLNRLLGTIYK